MKRGVFVTGTDTGVGKTVASAALVAALRARGLRVVPMKPIAAGASERGGQWINEDTDALLDAAGLDASWASRVTPVLLREPMAPHLAARHEARTLALEPLLAAWHALDAEFTVVEGVGGFRVPLGPDLDTADMARAFSGLGGYIRHKSKLNPRLRELAILQVGWLEKSEYEFTHHVKIGKEFGVTDDDIAALMIETEGVQSRLEPLARAILKGAREMTRNLEMSMTTFAEIKKDLSNEEMVDLVLTIAFYNAVVRVLATMKIDNEPYYKEVLQLYPIPGVS